MTFEILVKINNDYTSCISIQEKGDEVIIEIESSEKLECAIHVCRIIHDATWCNLNIYIRKRFLKRNGNYREQ